MAKKAYIIQEHDRNGFAMDTYVYGSKARAIKAFTEMVNEEMAYNYFKDAEGEEFYEVVKKLKEWNELYNIHTTHQAVVTRPYSDKKWVAVLLKESSVALEFGDVSEGKTGGYVHFQLMGECSGEYDSVESISLSEVELQ